MGILSRAIFAEVVASAVLGTSLFTFVLFLQRIGKLFEILVRSSAPPPTVAHLFALAIPFALTFTVPLGVLVGVLIALSRMSADGEITAIRAAGISSRKVVTPVLALAFTGMLITATATLWLTPYSISKTYRILNQLVAAELTAEVSPRIFEEQFPNRVLYIGDVIPGPLSRWRNVFIADLRPPDERNGGTNQERGDAPGILVAADAIAVPDVAKNRIQLSMLNSSTHEVGKDSTQYVSTSGVRREVLLEASKPNEVPVKEYTEMDTVPLYREAYKKPGLEITKRIGARIELHQRFALPPACILLALIGIPLGVSTRKGGKSAAFVLTVMLAFVYWMGLITANGLARQQKLPVGFAVWTPNVVFAVMGLILIARMERPNQRDWVGLAVNFFSGLWKRLRASLAGAAPVRAGRQRFPLVPQVVDGYVLTSFLFYFALLLVSFVAIFHVYTFFELLGDIVKNQIPMSTVIEYHFFLTPKLIYDLTPLSVLVAILITFGVLSKHNEVTAFKACGVSLYRLAIPILLASVFLSGGLFAFDHYYVPEANRRQDALRNKIKGRAEQTYLRPDRKWIYGQSSRIFYYKYINPIQKVMAGVNVYELDPTSYRLTKHISAERARWEPTLQKWIFENGWSRTFNQNGGDAFQNFTGQATTFPELTERPDYFLKEVLQDKQMNFEQLARYIKELQQSGFDTIALQVQFYRKFAVPLFAAIMALISIPFSFAIGHKGAMAGVGVSFGIAIAYIALGNISEQVGNVNLLPAALAAWSPDVLFALVGLYFFSRMRT